MWIWSYFSTSFLDYSGVHTTWNVQSVNGVVRFVRNDFRLALPHINSHWQGSLSSPALDPNAMDETASMFINEKKVKKWMGFRFAQTKPPPYQDGLFGLIQTTVAVIPDWPVVSVLAILPAMWALAWSFGRIRMRRRARTEERRAATGRCRKCGYLLAGISSGACPECGAPVATSIDEPSPQRAQQGADLPTAPDRNAERVVRYKP